MMMNNTLAQLRDEDAGARADLGPPVDQPLGRPLLVRPVRRGGFTTLDEHMPAAHRAHKQWTPERLIHWGGDIGVSTGRFVTQLLQRFRHPEHGYRSCLGLLSLAKRYGPQRVETACALALELGAGQYRNVRDILTNGRDLIERPVPAPEWVSPEHDNLRGASYFH